MTVTDALTANEETPPPPPPAAIEFEGEFGKNPLAEAGFFTMGRRLPAVLGDTVRMAWDVDRAAVLLLVLCQLLTGAAAAVLLAFTAKAMTHLLAADPVSERLQGALTALIVLTLAAGTGRISSALASYASSRITPG